MRGSNAVLSCRPGASRPALPVGALGSAAPPAALSISAANLTPGVALVNLGFATVSANPCLFATKKSGGDPCVGFSAGYEAARSTSTRKH